jgi:cysteinyl-tRNA synthetase
MVKYWMHNGLMRAAAAGKVGGRAEREQEEATVDTKISRSKGAGGLADLIREQGGERIRFFLLRTHYRSTIVFSDKTLAEAGTALEGFHRLFERVQRIGGGDFYQLQPVARRPQGEFQPGNDPLLAEVCERRRSFLAKMDDDFNTGGAVSDLFELARAVNKYIDEQRLEEPGQQNADRMASLGQALVTLRELTSLLGLFQQAPDKPGAGDRIVDQLMQLLVELRAEARKNKDFATADRIRDGLSEMGIKLEDRKDATGWRFE